MILRKLDLICYNCCNVDNQQTPTAGTPIYQESGEKNAKWLWLLIILIIVGALIFAFVRGVGPFSGFKSQGDLAQSPTPQAAASPSPFSESSPAASVDKKEPAIRILNGSGKTGVAGAVRDFLEARGWRVTALGNAANYNFERTVLRFKEGFGKFEEVLIRDLADNYSVTVSGEVLEATDSADIEVTVGTK